MCGCPAEALTRATSCLMVRLLRLFSDGISDFPICQQQKKAIGLTLGEDERRHRGLSRLSFQVLIGLILIGLI